MSLPVFVCDLSDVLAGRRPKLPEDTYVLTGPEAHHAVTVKRLKVGEELLLIDAHGSGVTATVTALEKSAVYLDVGARHEFPASGVTIVQALPKSERSELAVDLMTQGGAEAIVPWQASRCIAKWGNKAEKAEAKWRSAALAAAKQSRRMSVPTIHPLASTADVCALIEETTASGGTVVMLHEESSIPFASIDFSTPLVFIVGPEGGLSPEEVAEFSKRGAVAALLGPEVLRTATAGLVALAAFGAVQGWPTS